MKVSKVAFIVVFALVLQATLIPYLVGSGVQLDLVLVAIVYLAMTTSPVTALLSGAAGGVIQDTLSGGIIGVSGIAKTIVGFSVALVGTQIIVVRSFPRFVIFFGATLLHASVFLGLYSMLVAPIPNSSVSGVFGEALGNGLVGAVLFELLRALPRLRWRGMSGSRIKPRLEW